MTYNVFGGTLSLTQSINQSSYEMGNEAVKTRTELGMKTVQDGCQISHIFSQTAIMHPEERCNKEIRTAGFRYS